jgi:hypothetical protein
MQITQPLAWQEELINNLQSRLQHFIKEHS